MKSIVIPFIALILVSVLSFSIKAEDLPSGKIKTLSLGGFPNKISFGSEKANTLINFINSASAIYRDDIKQNLLYIHACMTAAYENDGDFGIIIEGNSTSTHTDSFIYGGNQASFAPGVNLINPSWSYYAYFMDQADERKMEYISPSGRGAGIDDARAARLNEILKKSDGLICKCSNTPWWQLSQADGGHRWNVACHSGPIMHAYVPVHS